MGVLLYLAVPVAIIVVVALAMWLRERRPTSVESDVASFRREMQALSPEGAPGVADRRSGGQTRRL